MSHLEFTRGPSYVLYWDVWEVHATGGKSYSGALKFHPDTGWVFESSDNSIRWKLGRSVAKAKRELRRRYRPTDHKGLCGCISYGSTHGSSAN